MEDIIALLIPALLAVLLVRTLLMPVTWIGKLFLHCACGYACLWLLNTVSVYTGIAFPANAVTILTAGTLGLPGIALLALLAVMG